MLNPEILVTEIRKITDASWSGHEGWPPDFATAAYRWLRAFDLYMLSITPPSTTRGQAFTVALATPPTIIRDYVPQAWGAYAKILAVGMQPLFTGVAPPLPLDVSSVLKQGENGASAEQCARNLALITSAWVKTGLAVPKTGPPIPWL